MPPTPFHVKRREALRSSSRGVLSCRLSSVGFLVVVVVVWITALLLFFGTALKSSSALPSSSSTSWVGSFIKGKKDKEPKPLSEAQILHNQVQDLERRLDAVDHRRVANPRHPLTLKHANKMKKEEEEAAAGKQQAQPQMKKKQQQEEKKPQNHEAEKANDQPEKKKKEEEYNSDTSPVPLVDPTILTRTPPKFEHPNMAELCQHNKDGDEDILKRVDVWKGAEMGKPRILCFSYTMASAHDNAVKNVRMTWAQKCDGYLAMSTLTDPEIPAIDIKHQGPESYDNMWQKLRSIWLYIHKHHLHEYDYFVSGGDDIFLIIENLRRYLLSDEILTATNQGTKPIFLGRAFRPPGDDIVFNSGGAGFVLNTAALEILGKGLQGTDCRPNQVGFWEDVNVAYCLHTHGVDAYNTTQDSHGRERFLPFNPGHHLKYRVPPNPDWYAKYTFDLKEGYDCCSEEAISYHYVKGEMMLRYHAILSGMCPNLTGEEGKKEKEGGGGEGEGQGEGEKAKLRRRR